MNVLTADAAVRTLKDRGWRFATTPTGVHIAESNRGRRIFATTLGELLKTIADKSPERRQR